MVQLLQPVGLVLFITMFPISTVHCMGFGGNLALGKTAKQSTTFIWYGKGGINLFASLAVDGNSNTDAAAFSCSHTTNSESPWWMVDLGKKSLVAAVQITNRDFPSLERLKNFKIKTSLELDKTDQMKSPELCYYMTDLQASGSTVMYSCEDTRLTRFVRIQLMYKEALTLCEVRVLPPANQIQSISESSLNKRSTGDILLTTQTVSTLQCLTECVHLASCSSINVRVISSTNVICELMSGNVLATDVDVEHWIHYTFQ